MIKRYKAKPKYIEAIQLTRENFEDCKEFIGNNYSARNAVDCYIMISTLEGYMTASENDFIIKGIHGQFYPCKPDIFHKSYEEII